ncbi:MAG: STAS domain-containing protein [Pseudolabrys sp.]|nr:STAS domain-containing protein [Pseudolabrys sp.]
MECSVFDQTGGVSILRLKGRLNMVSAGTLKAVVDSTIAGGHPRLAIDLSGVEFIDSSGLGALINALKVTRQAGGDLRIAAPTEQVKLVLQLTNVERVLPAYSAAEVAFANG